MIPESENDLVVQINDRYFSLKKNNPKIKTGILFQAAVDETFNMYGEIFGFKNSSELKSMYSRIKKIKAEKAKTILLKSTCTTNHFVDESKIVDELKEQVLNLGLNWDTYF